MLFVILILPLRFAQPWNWIYRGLICCIDAASLARLLFNERGRISSGLAEATRQGA